MDFMDGQHIKNLNIDTNSNAIIISGKELISRIQQFSNADYSLLAAVNSGAVRGSERVLGIRYNQS